MKQEAAHVRRSKKLKSDGPAPLPSPTVAPRHFRQQPLPHASFRHQPRPCATSATYRDPAPFPLLLYKASSTVRIKAGLALLFPNRQLLLHHRPPPRPGQAWRHATANPPRHPNSTAPPQLHRSPSARRQGRRRPEAVLPQPPQLLLLFRICPCLRTLLPLLPDLVLNSCSFNSLCKLFGSFIYE